MLPTNTSVIERDITENISPNSAAIGKANRCAIGEKEPTVSRKSPIRNGFRGFAST
jgi:hypothetical protein